MVPICTNYPPNPRIGAAKVASKHGEAGCVAWQAACALSRPFRRTFRIKGHEEGRKGQAACRWSCWSSSVGRCSIVALVSGGEVNLLSGPLGRTPGTSKGTKSPGYQLTRWRRRRRRRRRRRKIYRAVNSSASTRDWGVSQWLPVGVFQSTFACLPWCETWLPMSTFELAKAQLIKARAAGNMGGLPPAGFQVGGSCRSATTEEGEESGPVWKERPSAGDMVGVVGQTRLLCQILDDMTGLLDSAPAFCSTPSPTLEPLKPLDIKRRHPLQHRNLQPVDLISLLVCARSALAVHIGGWGKHHKRMPPTPHTFVVGSAASRRSISTRTMNHLVS